MPLTQQPTPSFPRKAGIQALYARSLAPLFKPGASWTPAFAGATISLSAPCGSATPLAKRRACPIENCRCGCALAGGPGFSTGTLRRSRRAPRRTASPIRAAGQRRFTQNRPAREGDLGHAGARGRPGRVRRLRRRDPGGVAGRDPLFRGRGASRTFCERRCAIAARPADRPLPRRCRGDRPVRTTTAGRCTRRCATASRKRCCTPPRSPASCTMAEIVAANTAARSPPRRCRSSPPATRRTCR